MKLFVGILFFWEIVLVGKFIFILRVCMFVKFVVNCCCIIRGFIFVKEVGLGVNFCGGILGCIVLLVICINKVGFIYIIWDGRVFLIDDVFNWFKLICLFLLSCLEVLF